MYGTISFIVFFETKTVILRIYFLKFISIIFTSNQEKNKHDIKNRIITINIHQTYWKKKQIQNFKFKRANDFSYYRNMY